MKMAGLGGPAGHDRAHLINRPLVPPQQDSSPEPDQVLEALRQSIVYAIALAVAAGAWLGAVLVYAISWWASRP